MKKVIDYLANKLKIQNKDLLEKDLLLHLLLMYLYKDNNFKKNYVFKGGTCLIKCYLGYYRFSEDLDFTFINQNIFKNKSEKQIRKELSVIIDDLSTLLISIANKLNLTFSKNKSDSKYYEFGANNKFTTFKLWYTSKTNNKIQFIKIQINFVDCFLYTPKTKKANNLIKKIDYKEFCFLFVEYKDLLKYPKIKVYNIEEILLEKYRAILTRKALKARDFIDIFLILRYIKKKPQIYTQKILDKTKFMLNKYKKYNHNLKLRRKLGFKYIVGEESKLLIKKINLHDLKTFNNKQILFLEEIIKKL
jgi:predicted nucleotidyltransferase component of viral defense system